MSTLPEGTTTLTRPEERFQVATSVAGYDFRAEPVSSSEARLLGSAQIFQGIYSRRLAGPQQSKGIVDLAQIHVLHAAWTNGQKAALAALEHTPDICWVSAGWKEIRAADVSGIDIHLGGNRPRFKVQVFEWPLTGERVLAAWTFIIHGKSHPHILADLIRSDRGSLQSFFRKLQNRWMRVQNLLWVFFHSRNLIGEKQFIRLSAKLDDPSGQSLETAVQNLREFVCALTTKNVDAEP